MAILAFLILFLASAAVQRIAATTPALYAFGDSTTDVGNYLREDPPPISTYRPYGIDFPGGNRTGRFSNGFLVVDYIAKEIGLSKSPPAYRAISNVLETLRGVNFASSGSGILNTTGQKIKAITLDEQIEDFNKISANLTALVGPDAAAIHLSLSLFYLNTGSNDLIAHFIPIRPVTCIQKDQIVASIISKFREQLQTLYKLGARKFAVVGTGTIGCAPVARRLFTLSHACFDDLNDLAVRFKVAVMTMLENLSETHKGFKYSFVDFYGYSNQVLAKPSDYGFTEITSACCGGGQLNAEVPCAAAGTTYCSNRTEYAFWDGLHATQELYKQLAQVALRGSSPWVTPVNVDSLILTIYSQLHAGGRSSAAVA